MCNQFFDWLKIKVAIGCFSNVSNYHRHDVPSKNIWIFIWPIFLIFLSFSREALNIRIYTHFNCQMKINIVKNFNKQSKLYGIGTSVQDYSIFYQFHESEIFWENKGLWLVNKFPAFPKTRMSSFLFPLLFIWTLFSASQKSLKSYICLYLKSHIQKKILRLNLSLERRKDDDSGKKSISRN